MKRYLFTLPALSLLFIGCSKEELVNSPRPVNANYSMQYSEGYNPSDQDEILLKIEEFLEGIVNEDLQDLPLEEGIWKLEASLNYAFRQSSVPLGKTEIDSLVFEIDITNGYMQGEQLRMVFNNVLQHCQEESVIRNLDVSFIDVTFFDDEGYVWVTPVYALHTPPPPSIPSMGDWKGNVHGSCGGTTLPCDAQSTSGHKIGELLVHRYYQDIYNNQNLSQAYVHFHTGIYTAGLGSAGVGGAGFIDCSSLGSFALDYTIYDNVRNDWELFGCGGAGALLSPTSNDYCVTEFYIEAYADILETRAVTYNPGNNRKLFYYKMGLDYIGYQPTPPGHHFPAAFTYGNFVYAQPSHSIHGF